MALDIDPTGFQLFHSSFIRLALHLHPIRPRVSLLGIKKPVVETRLIAQQQQPLGVHIKPADRIHPFRKTEIRQGFLTRLIRCELAEDTIRFVKKK